MGGMVRAFFLAIGLSAFIVGLECLVVEKAVLHARSESTAEAIAVSYREITPADWAPWSLLSAGAVVMLYSFTLPAKMRS
jgi:hypothetical protein